MKKILVLTNSNKPHKYFSKQINLHFPHAKILTVFQSQQTYSLRDRLIEGLSFLPIPKFLLGGSWLQLDRYKKYRNYFGNPETDFDFISGSLKDKNISLKIKNFKADLILVLGGKIISEDIFSDAVSIHLHCGIVPWYRGGATWYSNFLVGDFVGAGFTLQGLDAGIDTGSIQDQFQIKMMQGDTPWDLYCKCVVAGTDALVKLSEVFFKNGEVLSSPIPTKGFLHTGRFIYDKRRKARVVKNLYPDFSHDQSNNKNLITNNISGFKHRFICSPVE